jgi:hypothetical protein
MSINLGRSSVLIQKRIYEILLIFLLSATPPLFADGHKVLCIYTPLTAAQEPVYADVLEGIKKKVGTIEKLELPEDTDNIQAELDKIHPDKVIALGIKAADLAYKSSYHDKTIVGLIPFPAGTYSGVSLTLDINSIATMLERFIPTIKRIFVVQQRGYKTIENGFASRGKHENIVMKEGGDSLASIRLVFNIIEHEASASDAVFIPSNLPDAILFKLGFVAWEKNIKLFSTNMWHLENGALIVFYPNAIELGEQIGQMSGEKQPAYETARGIDAGLNRRSAQHLGVVFEPSVENLFAVKIK